MELSRKQAQVMAWWHSDSPMSHKDGIICDGAIRAGKTMPMSLSFVIWAMCTYEGENFAMCGKTIQALRRNVLKPLKTNLEQYTRYKIQEHRSENYLTITDGKCSNDFYIFGGKDESSQDLIQGLTLAGIFFDEVALMPESFVNQGTSRCSVEGAKFWFNCNPESPNHYIKTEWIDQVAEKNLYHIHFVMRDNPSLSEEVLARYERMYKGVFYDRFIKGLWVLASGIIFRYFAEDTAPYLFDDEDIMDSDGNITQPWSKLVIGMDFGGMGSKTTMCLMGYIGRFKEFRLLEECGLPLSEDIDAKKICDTFVEFYKMCMETYGRVDWILPDSASPTMINSLRSAAIAAGLPSRVIKGCRKNEISERPKTVDLLFNTGRLKIHKKCKQVIAAISALRWDEKHPGIPEDLNIGNCNDWWDAFCYTMLDFIEYIDLA